MTSTVRIPWVRAHNNEYRWNEVCAWAIEYFGLPGDRFETRANVDHLDFHFKNHKDALLMSLRWNAHIMSNEEVTVDFIGNMING